MQQLSAFQALVSFLLLSALSSVQGKDEGFGHCLSYMDAFERIEAEDYDISQGPKIERLWNLTTMSHIRPGHVLGYNNVEFLNGARVLEMRVSQMNPVVGRVNLHLDSVENSPLTVVDIGYTGQWKTQATIVQFLEYIPKGRHNVRFTFEMDQTIDNGGVVNIDWFQFYKE